MNCSTCQKNLSVYISGEVPEDVRNSMTTHLNECAECSLAYSTLMLTEKVIAEEISVNSNPFLATRIMSKIETIGEEIVIQEKDSIYARVLKPVLITASVSLALFIGVMAGNTFSSTLSSENIPEELAYMNDASMESLNLFVTE